MKDINEVGGVDVAFDSLDRCVEQMKNKEREIVESIKLIGPELFQDAMLCIAQIMDDAVKSGESPDLSRLKASQIFMILDLCLSSGQRAICTIARETEEIKRSVAECN